MPRQTFSERASASVALTCRSAMRLISLMSLHAPHTLKKRMMPSTAHIKIIASVDDRLIDGVPTYCNNIILNFSAKIQKTWLIT